MATAAAVSPSCVSDKWIVTFSRCSAIAPVSRTRGRPHMSVTTSISRWMPSGSTGRFENRETDHALITASLAAQRAARWRAATELLSAASRLSPGVNVSANTVPGWSTCSAKPGMETTSIPTPTIATMRTLAEQSPDVGTVLAESSIRIQQHLRFRLLLRYIVIEPAVGGPLVERSTTGHRGHQPAPAGQRAPLRLRDVGRPLIGIERSDERLRVHHRDQTRHVPEPETGHQTGLQRELVAHPQRLAHPDEVLGVGQLVVDTVQAAVRRNDTVAQDLAQAHRLERRRAA